ncbi:Origin recognition complex subunit 2 [Umbelopsis sp. WA50703]
MEMSELIVRNQDDDEIAEHFVNTVHPKAAKREADIAKSRKLHNPHSGFVGRRYYNAGLTVASTELADEVPSLLKQHDDAEQILLHAPNRLNQAQDNTDEVIELGNGSGSDKENGAVGRDMFGINKVKGKGVESMMKKAMATETKPPRARKQGFFTKVNNRLAASNDSRATTANADQSMKTGKRSNVEGNLESTQEKRRKGQGDIGTSENGLSQARKRKRQFERKVQKLDEKETENSDISESDNEQQEEEDESDDEQVAPNDGLKKDGYERYFQDLHASTQTSNNTLSKLPILDPKEFKEKLSQAPKKHAKDIEILHSLHERQFPQWQFELLSHYNLLFYGYGSKRKLLTKFAENYLNDGPLIVVNGYFPSITIRDILNKLSVDALGINAPTGSIQDHVSLIMEHFQRGENEYDNVYLLIHNIDGVNLRNERVQTALSVLASCPNIHIIASIDHINAGLLWDSIKIARFNWIWHDATTFDNYLTETSFENTLMVRQSEIGGSRGVNYVLASLTSNARGIFKVLAEHQIIEMELATMEGRGDESVGLTYNAYYTKCREAFYVSNDVTFRTQLTEFRDHKIIQSKRSVDGTEIMYLPLDKSTLTSILETIS